MGKSVLSRLELVDGLAYYTINPLLALEVLPFIIPGHWHLSICNGKEKYTTEQPEWRENVAEWFLRHGVNTCSFTWNAEPSKPLAYRPDDDIRKPIERHLQPGVFPTLSPEWKIKARIIDTDAQQLQMVEVWPSEHDGFFHFSISDRYVIDETKRPVAREMIPNLLSSLGFNLSAASYVAEYIDRDTRKLNILTPLDLSVAKHIEESKSSNVYFIQSELGGPIKIGVSVDPKSRMAEIQRMSPFKLRILKTIEGDYSAESALHKRFSHLRLHGEWFEPADELLNFIAADQSSDEPQ